MIKLDPSTGARIELDARRADAAVAAPITLDMEFAEKGGEARRPTRCCSTQRWSARRTRFTRQDGVEETWRIMQPLLDAPPPVHSYAPGSWGPTRPPISSSPGMAAGTSRGSRA